MRRRGIALRLFAAAGMVLGVGGPTAGESSARDLGETFHSPLHGVEWHALRDDDTGRKWFETAAGGHADTLEEIVLREQAELPPLERIVESSLVRDSEDPDRVGELVDVTIRFRNQPAHEAGTAARERFAPLVAAPLARLREMRSRLAQRRADPNVVDPAEDAKLLTEAEKSQAGADRNELHRLVAQMRSEICTRASAEATSDQAAVRAWLEARPDVKMLGSSWILSTVSARVPLVVVIDLANRFPEIGRIERMGRAQATLDISVPTMGTGTWWNANGTGSSSTPVAVLDTGIDGSHPALTVSSAGVFHSAASSQSDYNDNPSSTDDYYGHGTHCAGIVASADSTYTGVAPGAGLMTAKCGYTATSGAWFMDPDIFSAGDWAVNHGAAVMSCSFGGAASPNDGSGNDSLFFDAAVFDLGVAVAIAAGNNGSGSGSVTEPGDAFNVVTVGAFDDGGTTSWSGDAIASFSGRGPTYDGRRKPDIVAPGVNIYSCNSSWEGSSNPDFVNMSGTSMATPHVAGALALLLDSGAAWTPEGAKALLLTTARNTSPAPTSPGNTWGYGGIDLGRANTYAASVYEGTFSSSGAAARLLQISSLPAGGRVTLVWNRHVRSNTSSAPTTYYALVDLDLEVYDGSTGAVVASSTSSVNCVEQVKVTNAVSSPVVKVIRAGSFPSGVTSESFALAAETTGATSMFTNAALSMTFTQAPPSFIYANTNYPVSVTVTNTGAVSAGSPVVGLNVPSNYVVPGGQSRTLATLAGGASASASFTVRAVSGPSGTQTITAGVTSTAYGEQVPSSGASTTHVLDDVPPTGSIAIDAGATFAASTNVTLTLSASDGSGLDAMRLRGDGGAWGAWGAFAASRAWTLSGQGTHTVDVEYRDVVGNVSQFGDGIMYDTTAPTGSAMFGDGSPYTNATTAAFVLSATDAVSGVAEQRIGTDAATFGAWQSYGSSNAIQLGSSEGATTRYAQFKDAAGNVSATVSATVTRDVTAPTGSVVLDGGAAATNRSSATLTTTATDALSGVASTRIGFDGVTWLPWIPYTSAVGVGLPNLNGVSTVYAQFRDAAGNASPTYSDSIVVDAAPPTASLAIENGARFTGSSTVTLSLSATDALTGVAAMRLADDGASWGSWQSYATSMSWTLPAGEGPRTVHAQFVDGSGNISDDIEATITVDKTPPSGGIGILGGAKAVNHSDVALSLSAADSSSGLADVRLRADAGAWTGWTAFVSDVPFTLTAGEGVRKVEAQFRDAVGNASAAVSAQILVDWTRPTGTLVLNDAAALVLPWERLRAEFTSDDGPGGSGTVSAEVSLDAGATWGEPLAPVGPADLAWPVGALDGPGEVRTRFRDAAGNVSDAVSASAYFVAAPTQGLDAAKSLTGALAAGGDVDCYTLELLQGDVLTVKLSTRPAKKGGAFGVDLDLYDPSHEKVVSGRWPVGPKKKPGIAKFAVGSSGTYVVVVRAGGADVDAGGTYALASSAVRAKGRMRLKGVASPGPTVDGIPTTTATFAAAQGDVAGGAVKGLVVTTPVDLVGPDGSVTRYVVRPVHGTAKLPPLPLAGGTGDYVLWFFARASYSLSLKPARRAARAVEILPPGQR